MKSFLIVLSNVLKKDHPDAKLEFYVSRRSKFVHMGSNVSLNKIKDYERILREIEELWKCKKTDDKFQYCKPYLTASTKWKFDYVIFKKKYD